MVGLLARMVVTLVAVAAAIAVGWQLWMYYTLSPWTRDARVLANVVSIAPDVSGLISSVSVKDNQFVKTDDVLFTIDQERFEVAAQEATAQVDLKKQAMKLAKDDAARDATLVKENSPAISAEAAERSATKAAEAVAELHVALANLAIANINLKRSKVRAPADGYITNLNAFVGNYATVGQSVMALVETQSFYVYAYFMETKIPAIREGATVKVKLMAGGVVIDGLVEGLSRAIANTADKTGLLENVDPEFDWIRLAQRIPVRIRLGDIPAHVQLAAGMSATVIVSKD